MTSVYKQSRQASELVEQRRGEVSTGIVGGDDSSAPKVATARYALHLLVVVVVGVRGMVDDGVGNEAGHARLDVGAVGSPLAAGPIETGQQRLVAGPPVGDAPRPVLRHVGDDAGASEVYGVDRRLVGVEEAPVAVGLRPLVAVLVEELVDVHLQLLPPPRGRADARHHPLHQVLIVALRVAQAGAQLVGVAPRRPPGLEHHHPDVAEVGGLQRGVHGVQHGVEDVGVVQVGERVVDAGVGQEERVVEGDGVVALLVQVERLQVKQKVGAGVGQEAQHGQQVLVQQRLVEGAHGRREGVGQHTRGAGRGDGDAAEAGAVVQRRVQVVHGQQHEVQRVGAV